MKSKEINKVKTVDISVIIPIYNEGYIISELYYRLQKVISAITFDYEFIFINDGSNDHSLFELMRLAEQDRCVFYINFSRNFGHQIAISAGIDVCKGKATIIIDGDLQDPLELIRELYLKYMEGYEVVYAKRHSRKGESYFKRFTAKLFYRILRMLTTIDIPLDTGDYRIIDQRVVHYLRQMSEQNKFLRGQIAWLGFRQAQVLFTRDKRQSGKTGYSLGKMLHFAMDGITGFSEVPLKLSVRLGFAISIVSFIIILYAMISFFVLKRTITGWTSLIISSMLIGGIQLICIGLIGEYISRINKNIINRPLYIIDKTNIDLQGKMAKK